MAFNKIQKILYGYPAANSNNSGEFIDYTMQDVSSATSGTELCYEIFMLGYK